MAKRRDLGLALVAVGLVYGDIGTSPLYAIRECLAWHPEGRFAPHAVFPSVANVLGVLSLVFWALVLVVGIKYLVLLLRADNQGEGGILALAGLADGIHEGACRRRLGTTLVLALLATGLLIGDGLITPAISVLGAVEGLAAYDPALDRFVVPAALVVVLALFVIQRRGSKAIGAAVGPVMLSWFLAIGALGLRWIVERPDVLWAIDPRHAVGFLAGNGVMGFVVIGLVFLVVIGGEALYADLGQFGRRPIRIAWFSVVLPCLLLSYFGQGALLLAHEPGTIANPFYATAGSFAIPMLLLATAAAAIASQAMISGVFTLVRQAIQLDLWPRVTVVHASSRIGGQVYIPQINWLLMLACVGIVVAFETSSSLASAYGIAVAGTMTITTLLFYAVCRRRWRFSRGKALALVVPFLAIDVAFWGANLWKVLAGGLVPLVAGALVFVVMSTWRRGRQELARINLQAAISDEVFLADLRAHPQLRVRGTAVFMSPVLAIPNTLLHHLKHNKSLHEQVVIVTVRTENVPWVDVDATLRIADLGQGFFRIVAHYGFMQSPDIPRLLARCADRGIRTEQMTYYLGRKTLLASGTSELAGWRKRLFIFLEHNSRSAAAAFGLPPNRVVELGAQIEI